MAILPILVAPDPRLKAKAQSVEAVDGEIRQLMDDMLQSMYKARGIGLAAPQVGVSKRVIVMDISTDDEEPNPLRMANPEIIWASEDQLVHEEGCLSLPEQFADVMRPTAVKVRYLDHENEIRELVAEEMLAICVQHEMDHLEGTLFVDRLTNLKRNMILRKLQKARRGLPTTV
ncbi:peptide deformylase [Magnetovibrio blakemorei]|uniref:Peptide deformylase n=1 Tax=Magnetovibrio blakemorei TaxID=28181 RepID=A0A1E5QC54_9PROT|nr:peptide deformylase [Magnetovibrio blakemorei]OEJ69263.1 peptide deformylase [Magnetovibrio blakemorei]